MKDRLWFFGGYQYLRDYDSQPGADPAFPRTYEQDKIFAKLTWRLTPNLQLMQSFHEEIWVNPTVPTATTPFIATLRNNAKVPSMTFANLTQVLSNKTVWEMRVGRFIFDQKSDPSSDDRTTPSHRQQGTNILSQNAPQIGTVKLDRVTAKAVLHRYQSGGVARIITSRPAPRSNAASTSSLRPFREASSSWTAQLARLSSRFPARRGLAAGGSSTPRCSGATAFRSTTGSRLMPASGSITSARSVRIWPASTPKDATTDGFTEGLGTLYTWNLISPRLGITVKLDADARTVLRANYGRFNQGVLTGELDRSTRASRP